MMECWKDHPTQLCIVCSQQSPDYKCPRCLSPYCSLKCYKNHGLQCTESFYKEQCLSVSGPKPTLALHQTLQRNVEEITEDQEAEDWERNLEQLEKLALSGELTEHHLSAELREEFQRYLVQAGRGHAEVELWRPWWISDLDMDPLVIIEDFEMWKKLPINKAILEKASDRCDVRFPSITLLSSKAVSAELYDHVIDGILATAFALRRSDGDLLTDPAESFNEFISVSSVLISSDTRMVNADEIISVFLEKAIVKSAFSFCMVILYDVICVLNQEMIANIYQELILLLEACMKFVKSKQKRNELERIQRKTTFFASINQNMIEADRMRLWKALTEKWKTLCSDQEETEIIRVRKEQLNCDRNSVLYLNPT